MRRATTLLVFCVGGLLALGLVTLYSASIYMQARPHRLTVADLKNVSPVAARLARRADPVAAFLADQFSPAGQWAVSEALAKTSDIKTVRRVLVDEFNRILAGPLIYNSVLFSRVDLRADTRKLAESNPTDTEIAHANRLLLEDAFPHELSRKKRPGLLFMQLAWAALGVLIGIGAAAFDYRKLKDWSWLIYAVAIVLLALVFVPHIGVKKNGAFRWLDFRVAGFQPSELAKFALIIVLAHYAEFHRRQMVNVGRGLVLPGLLVAPLLGLIIFEPDFGTTILLVLVTASMLVLAGSSWKWVVTSGAAIAVAIGVAIYHNPVRFNRILAFLDPEAHKSGVGYQAWQALVAIGSGGWSGLGLGNGLQKLGFVPENHTDFILSVIGEELGLVATLGIVLAYVVLVICGLFIASHARDRFGFLLGAGISLLIGFQAFINIGVVTSSLPNKGLPLPFISYGGSSLLMMLIGVGILLSIARQAAAPESATVEVLDENAVPAT